MSSTEEVRSIYQHETNGISLPLLSFFPQYFVVTPILFDDLWIWVKTLYTAHIHTAAYSLRCWCCLFYWVIKNGRTSHQGDESTFYSLLRVDIKFLVLKQHNLFRGKMQIFNLVVAARFLPNHFHALAFLPSKYCLHPFTRNPFSYYGENKKLPMLLGGRDTHKKNQ